MDPQPQFPKNTHTKLTYLKQIIKTANKYTKQQIVVIHICKPHTEDSFLLLLAASYSLLD